MTGRAHWSTTSWTCMHSPIPCRLKASAAWQAHVVDPIADPLRSGTRRGAIGAVRRSPPTITHLVEAGALPVGAVVPFAHVDMPNGYVDGLQRLMLCGQVLLVGSSGTSR
jgi:hypothetical protein